MGVWMLNNVDVKKTMHLFPVLCVSGTNSTSFYTGTMKILIL